MQDIERQGAEAVTNLNREIALYAIGNLVAELKEKYAGAPPEVPEYIDAVQNDILENIQVFLGVPEQEQGVPPPQFQAFMREIPFRKYEVNVVVDNATVKGAPVVFEQNPPTYQNLLGKIEKEVQFGIFTTDFTMIRPGSLHKANGGYLVLDIEDILRAPLSWDGLKTALKTGGEAVIEEPGERMGGFITAKTIKPEAIPLDIKVSLIGTPMLYHLLYQYDPDFKELFKVKADFDTVMERNDENANKYADFICNLVREENLRHLEREAIARVIEYGSRLAADKEKLSTQFSAVADLIREANFYAVSDGSDRIERKHVTKAIEEKIYRSNLIQQKIEEYIRRGGSSSSIPRARRSAR